MSAHDRIDRARLILSTCGTSLLTNGAPPALKEFLRETANARECDLDIDRRRRMDERIREQAAALAGATPVTAAKLSAELAGIVALGAHERPSGRAPDQHILVHTDTAQGAATAGMVHDWLNASHLAVQVYRVPELSTAAVDPFRRALGGLVSWCQENLAPRRSGGERVLFNLVGGFKSVQGFFQALGQIYADECVYIFEGSGQLLTLPRLPFRLEPEPVLRERLDLFRRLDVGLPVSARECEGIPEALLFFVGDETTLSEWGKLAWKATRLPLLGKELLPPLRDNIRYSNPFRVAVRDLPAERIAIVNDRLGDLARALLPNSAHNPTSLGYKKLAGNPHPPSTHELRAWSDGGAWRIFGHHEAGTFVLDRLAQHL